jgi:hypothetical protein
LGNELTGKDCAVAAYYDPDDDDDSDLEELSDLDDSDLEELDDSWPESDDE